jgi:putative FmdB family regulatory protein
MPFYEYECPSCRYYLELLQKISDPPVKKCPSCGKTGFKRLISAPVFRLKGAGWYETDFKSDKENKRNLVGADRDEAKPASAETKTEAKPEAAETKDSKAETAAPKAEAQPKAAETKAGAAKPDRTRRRSRAARTPTRRAPRKAK